MSLGSRDLQLLVCFVPYSCMLTQLYNNLLGVTLVNPNDNLLHTLDTWQIFGTRRSYTGLPQCYFRPLVVMLYFKFMHAVFCGILRCLSLVVPS